MQATDRLLERPCFGLTLDAGHNDCAQEADASFFKQRMDGLKHVHDARGKECHLALGTGQIQLDDCFLLAEESVCKVVLETKTAQAPRPSIDWLKQNRAGFAT